MSVYLSYSKDENGELHHISEVIPKGLKLYCPFCDCELIAVKGLIKSHHFRHNGDSCKESLTEVPSIPGWHYFHLDYPLAVVEELKKGYDPKKPKIFQGDPKSYRCDIPYKYHDELFVHNPWAYGFEFTDVASVIVGAMTLERFKLWMRNKLADRIQKIAAECRAGKHRAWFDIEAHRQRKLLNATLYFAQYEFASGEVLYKVGRTNREVEIRLEETRADLQAITGKKVNKVRLLRQAEDCGYVEKYVFHRYAESLANIDTRQEYLSLTKKQVAKLKTEFTRLATTELDLPEDIAKNENWIKTGRWLYEEKRIEASKKAIREIVNDPNRSFGRPKGTSLSDEDLILKYPWVANCLLKGRSLRATQKRTGVSLSTVKRVKKALNNNPDISFVGAEIIR